MYRKIRYPVKEGELLAAHVTLHGAPRRFSFVSVFTDPKRHFGSISNIGRTKDNYQRVLDVINSSNEWFATWLTFQTGLSLYLARQSFVAMHFCFGCGCKYGLSKCAMLLLLLCICIAAGFMMGWFAGFVAHWVVLPLAVVVCAVIVGMHTYHNDIVAKRARAVNVFIVSLLERVHRETGVKWTLNDSNEPPLGCYPGISRAPSGWTLQPRRA